MRGCELDSDQDAGSPDWALCAPANEWRDRDRGSGPRHEQRGAGVWGDQRKWRLISLAYRRPSVSLFCVIHWVTAILPVAGPSVSASPSAIARYSSRVSSVSRSANPRIRAVTGMSSPGTRMIWEWLPTASLMMLASS